MSDRDISNGTAVSSGPRADEGEGSPWQFDDLVEFPLLLTGQQAQALEAAARRRGLTAAQLLRQLILQLSQ